MKKLKVITGLLAALVLCMAFAGCGSKEQAEASKTIHVSVNGSDEKGDGSEQKPFATIGGVLKVDNLVGPGTEIIVHEGTYEPFRVSAEASGTENAPVIICAAQDEKVIVKATKDKLQSGEEGMKQACGIHMLNVSNIVVRGFEIEGGTHGILYESTDENGDQELANVCIEENVVHDVVGAHGIAIYACNTETPVKGLILKANQVYDCLCGDSESMVVNGNIDGFTITENLIHDNNNIGIDMIGFEGNAKKAGGGGENPYEVDFARNGKCFGNTVYNISSDGNPAYFYDGEYDLCADGIYVDGGQDIEIYDNFVFNCDIGLEVATEHSPDKNELFKVSGIKVHDNVVADCKGWCGLCFGGYDRDLGFTENCEFTNNTFVDNETQIGVQRSSGNLIENNLFVGDGSSIEFNGDCREKDLVNDFRKNVWCISEGTVEDNMDYGDFDLEVVMPNGSLLNQDVINDRSMAINGFASMIEGAGSSYVPGDKLIEIYEKNREAD